MTLALEITIDDNQKLHLQELETLDVRRLHAQQRIKFYQAWISRAFNKKVNKRVFKQDNLALAVQCSMVMTHKFKGEFLLK